MLFGPHNFLTFIRDLVMGGGRDSAGNARNDGGFLVTDALRLPGDLTTIDGLTLTGATVPAVLRTETNGMTVAGAASTTALGSFTFQVPRDYDEATDEFKIRVLAGMDGATDTPTLDATIYRKRAGVALSADLNPTASAALAADTAWKTIDGSGKALKRDDVLTINILSGAHTTNALSVHAIEIVYRSCLVSYEQYDASNNALR